jgi:hypothetical protein
MQAVVGKFDGVGEKLSLSQASLTRRLELFDPAGFYA